MDLSTKLSSCEVLSSPLKVPIKDLTEPAKIQSARRINTRFGTMVIVLHVTTSAGEERVTFLPSRFTSLLTDEDLECFTNSKLYSVKCTGMVGNSPNVLIYKH